MKSIKLKRIRFLNQCKYIIDELIEQEKVDKNNDYMTIVDIDLFRYDGYRYQEKIEYIADYKDMYLKFNTFSIRKKKTNDV